MELKSHSDRAIREITLTTKEQKNPEDSWYLELLSSNKEDTFLIQIKKFPFYIGRNVDCELLLPFQYISRYHAQIVNEKDILRIVPIDSNSNIYINHKRIDKSTILRNDDVLHFNKNFNSNTAFKIVSKYALKSRDIQSDNNNQNNSYDKDKTQFLQSITVRKQFLEGTDCAFSVGLPLYLELQGKEKSSLKTYIFSWKKGSSLTVEVSGKENLEIKEGTNCAARFLFDGKAYGFLAKIQHIDASDNIRLSLTYPLKISYISYRRTTRYKTNLKARIRKSIKGDLIDCTIVDISLNGLRVSFPYKMRNKIKGEVFLSIVDILNDIRVKKVHEIINPSDCCAGFEVISFGGLAKKRRYEEVLDFHAPLGDNNA